MSNLTPAPQNFDASVKHVTPPCLCETPAVGTHRRLGALDPGAGANPGAARPGARPPRAPLLPALAPTPRVLKYNREF